MIKKIKFSNFYSFKEEQVINFLAQKKKTYDYFQSKSNSQITKISGFAGGNASGKTNVIRALSFFRHFVCERTKDESIVGNDTAFKTFFNNKLVSNFYIEFETDNKTFFHEFSIKNNIITKESIYIKKFDKYAKKILVISRKNNKIEKFSNVYFKGFKKNLFENIRQDMSLIPFLKSNYKIEIINTIYTYFFNIKSNLSEKGGINGFNHKIKALNLYLDNPDIKSKMEDFISNFDVGLKGFDIKKTIEDNRYKIIVTGIHSSINNDDNLSFNYESMGTQSLFFTLANIFYALKNNSVVLIDEIESGLHPEAFNKLISFFIDECAEKNTQLIFSSHSLGFMNVLDMHQIFLVEKNLNGESELFRLKNVEKIRSDENFLAKYLAGAYGGFPKIRV